MNYEFVVQALKTYLSSFWISQRYIIVFTCACSLDSLTNKNVIEILSFISFDWQFVLLSLDYLFSSFLMFYFTLFFLIFSLRFNFLQFLIVFTNYLLFPSSPIGLNIYFIYFFFPLITHLCCILIFLYKN